MRIRRQFDYLIGDIRIEVNDKTYYLPKNQEISINLEENTSDTITVSAWGFYSSRIQSSELCNNENYVVTTALPVWFTTFFLSLFCLLFIIGICKLIPNIVGSSLLLLFLLLVGFYSTVKRSSFFKILKDSTL